MSTVKGTNRSYAQRACDGCRLRRIRCNKTQNPDEDITASACDACSAASLECTYWRPVTKRGPRPKPRFGLHPKTESSATVLSAPPSLTSDSTSQSSNRLPTPETSVEDNVLLPKARSARVPSTAAGRFCSDVVFGTIMQDYIDRIYPVMPLVHVPSFRTDLDNNRQATDAGFFALTLAIAVLVVTSMPHTLEQYRALDWTFPYGDRGGMFEAAERNIMELQRRGYWDLFTYEKWATNYILGFSLLQMRSLNKSHMYQAQARAIFEELGFDRIAEYRGLDPVETQLRKKAFSMSMITCSHLKVRGYELDLPNTRFAHEDTHSGRLLPLELDDEEIGTQADAEMDSGIIRIVSGIIALSRFSLCLLSSKRIHVVESALPQSGEARDAQSVKQCICGRHIVPVSNVEQLKHRLREVKKLVDEIPPYLKPGFRFEAVNNSPGSTDSTRALQFETMAAGIAVSSLWIQHTLLESIFACSEGSRSLSGIPGYSGPVGIWEVRENICSQMLQALESLSPASIEPNGGVLLYKLGSVGAIFLEYPFKEHDEASTRVKLFSKQYKQKMDDLITYCGFQDAYSQTNYGSKT